MQWQYCWWHRWTLPHKTSQCRGLTDSWKGTKLKLHLHHSKEVIKEIFKRKPDAVCNFFLFIYMLWVPLITKLTQANRWFYLEQNPDLCSTAWGTMATEGTLEKKEMGRFLKCQILSYEMTTKTFLAFRKDCIYPARPRPTGSEAFCFSQLLALRNQQQEEESKMDTNRSGAWPEVSLKPFAPMHSQPGREITQAPHGIIRAQNCQPWNPAHFNCSYRKTVSPERLYLPERSCTSRLPASSGGGLHSVLH